MTLLERAGNLLAKIGIGMVLVLFLVMVGWMILMGLALLAPLVTVVFVFLGTVAITMTSYRAGVGALVCIVLYGISWPVYQQYGYWPSMTVFAIAVIGWSYLFARMIRSTKPEITA